MAAGQLDLWGALALLALLAIVAVLLWGVFRSTGKKPIRPSGREHHHDDFGSRKYVGGTGNVNGAAGSGGDTGSGAD